MEARRPLALAQLRAMIRYEFRMHWRSRGILAVLLMITTLMLLNLFDTSVILQRPGEPALTPEQQPMVVTAAIVRATFPPIGLMAAVLLPILAAEVIPLDRQRRLRDLLDALPLPYSVYLAGKLIGLWLLVMIGLAASMLLVGLAWRLRFGPYDPRPLIEAWLVGGGVIAMVNSGLSVLIAAGQPNRRRGVVVVILALVAVFMLRDFHASAVVSAAHPLRIPILNYYLNQFPERGTLIMFAPVLPTADTLRLAFVMAAAQLALAWVAVWCRHRWQGGKS